MSINIGLVSDKPEFSNYFSQQIVFPTNAECTLVKSSVDIPLLQMVSVKVPALSIGQRGNDCLQVMVDGIFVNLTWTDLYTAHTTLNATDVDRGVTANQYFSGSFEYIPNNKLFVIDPATTEPDTNLHFIEVLEQAMFTKFEFYDFRHQLIKEVTDLDNVFTTQDPGLITRNYTATDAYIMPFNLKGWTINTTYTPQKLLDNTLAVLVPPAASVLNYTQTANNLTSSAAGINQAWWNNEEGFDLNGGWYQFRARMTAGAGTLMATGITFEGVGTPAAGDEWKATADYQPEVLDVGIQFENDAAGAHTFKIIDGNEQYVYYDTGVPGEVTTTKPIFHPSTAKHEFQNNDFFFIQIQRGNLYNGTNEFIVNIYQGNIGDLGHANTKRIYTSTRTLPTSAVVPNVGFMTTANAGNEFDAVQYIARTAQTTAQCEFQINNASAQFTGVFQLDPIVSQQNGGQAARDFWSAWGMPTDSIAATVGSTYNSIDSKDQTLRITRPTTFVNSNSQIRYFLGETLNNEVFLLDPNINCLVVNTTSAKSLANLPRQLKVALNNVPIKSFQGQYNRTSNYAVSSGGEERVIGTIPLPEVDITDVSIPISYEPFNLLYRPMNNVEPFMINTMLVQIYYQDFDTNERKAFDTINGHLTLDINVRQGAKPPKPQNNLVPV